MHPHSDLREQNQVCTVTLGIWDELRHLAYCIGNFIVHTFADSPDAAYFLTNEKGEKYKEIKCRETDVIWTALSSLLTVMNTISRHMDLETCHGPSWYLGLQSKADGTRSKHSQEYIQIHPLGFYTHCHPSTLHFLIACEFATQKMTKTEVQEPASITSSFE